MRTAGLVVAAGLSLLGVRQAQAVKLIVHTEPVIVEVPPHPTLVVRTQRLEGLDPTDLSGKRHFAFTVTPIDDYWAAVTIDAKPGETFIDRRFSYLRQYRVVAHPAAVTRDVVDATGWTNEGVRGWEIHWMGADGRAWTRVDWAYTPQDIDRGRYGSLHESVENNVVRWSTAPDVDRVFLRVMTFRVNGQTDVTRLWLTRDGDDVTVHDGVGPAPTPAPPTTCVVRAPRPVPIDPTFRVDVFATPRFHVVATDGRELPSRLAATDRHGDVWSLKVSAPEGSTFTVERFPVLPGCPRARLLRATSDRSHDEPPEVVGQSPHSPITVSVAVEDPDTWDSFEVTSRDEATNEATNEAISEHPYASYVGNDISVPSVSEYATPRIFVTITPIWGSARGTPWKGWVSKDATVDPLVATIVEPAIDSMPPPTFVIRAVAPAPSATSSPASRGRRVPVRPVLVVVLLLGLLVSRPRIVAAWTR